MLLAGLVLLVVGAEALVRGASKIAAAFGIPPLIIGLTVVAFGTSAPELAVGVQAALTGNADIALGNVIGSNIFNILVIIGLSAVIIPLVVHQQLVRWEVPLVIGLSILVLIMGLDGKLGRIEGALLFLGLITARSCAASTASSCSCWTPTIPTPASSSSGCAPSSAGSPAPWPRATGPTRTSRR